MLIYLFDFLIAQDDSHEPRKRRIADFLAQRKLAARERGKILSDRAANTRVIRQKCLNNDPSGGISAARSSSDLCDKLKRALGGAKVWQSQRRISADHPD